MSYSIVIPARFDSKRLPGKALKDINGKTMIERAYESALGSQAAEIIIATDSEKIKDVCKTFGAKCLITSSEHKSGTDRVNEVAVIENWSDEMIIVNLQGDNALMPSANIDQVAKLLFDNPSYSIATLGTDFLSKDEEEDRNAVKVFINKETNEAITFKRNLKGYDKQSVNYLRHIGVYAYTRSSLRTFSDSDASIEEENEKLEQLRAYGLKLRIIVGKASVTPGPDVDTYEDLLLVKSIYNSPKS